jgi:[histone H3]-lysine36 N-trimethyltransferase
MAEVKREASVDGELAQELSTTRVATIKHEDSASPSASPALNPSRLKSSRSSSASASSNRPVPADVNTAKTEPKEPNGHHLTSTSPVKPEPRAPSKPAKLSRAASKLPPRVAPLFHHLPDATEEATSTFTVIDACTYQNKYLGYSEHALDCECSEEWGEFIDSHPPCGELPVLIALSRFLHQDESRLRR